MPLLVLRLFSLAELGALGLVTERGAHANCSLLALNELYHIVRDPSEAHNLLELLAPTSPPPPSTLAGLEGSDGHSRAAERPEQAVAKATRHCVQLLATEVLPGRELPALLALHDQKRAGAPPPPK